MLEGGAHRLQEESRPHPKGVKSNRIGGLEGWYSLAPATQSNMISVMNGGKKTKHPDIVTNLLFVHYLFFYLFSSAFQIFLELTIKNVKAVP